MSLYKKHGEQESKSYTHKDLALHHGLGATAELTATVDHFVRPEVFFCSEAGL